VAASPPQGLNSRAIALEREISVGKAQKEAIDKDIYAIWKEFRQHKQTFNDTFDHAICTSPESLNNEIEVIRQLSIKVEMALDLKQTQLKELMAILTHENYTETGLASDSDPVQSACKGLSEYIKRANETALKERKELDEHIQEVAADEMRIEKHPCPCEWGQWAEWSDCSATCGGGKQNRARTIKKHATNGGEKCHGGNEETTGCNANPCPIDCQWGHWNQWPSCGSCPEEHLPEKTRTRVQKVKAEHGGKECDDSDYETKVCSLEDELKIKISKLNDENKALKVEKAKMKEELEKLSMENKDLEKELQQCDKGAWPEEVFVTLKNGAHSAWGSRLAGKFIKQAGETNGRPFWLNDDHAIWYEKQYWNIGRKKDLGTDICALHSTTEAPGPVGLRWKYWNNDEKNWVDAEEEDVLVQPATEGKVDSTQTAELWTSPLEGRCQKRTNVFEKGCHKIKERKECLTSTDGRKSYKGQDCVWCHDGCWGKSQKCSPQDWLDGQIRKGNKIVYETCLERPTLTNGLNLHMQVCQKRTQKNDGDGCNEIKDRRECLTSMDGRDYAADGIYLRGQHCVWCNGKPCSGDNNNKCEPQKWLDKVGNGTIDYETCLLV